MIGKLLSAVGKVSSKVASSSAGAKMISAATKVGQVAAKYPRTVKTLAALSAVGVTLPSGSDNDPFAVMKAALDANKVGEIPQDEFGTLLTQAAEIQNGIEESYELACSSGSSDSSSIQELRRGVEEGRDIITRFNNAGGPLKVPIEFGPLSECNITAQAQQSSQYGINPPSIAPGGSIAVPTGLQTPVYSGAYGVPVASASNQAMIETIPSSRSLQTSDYRAMTSGTATSGVNMDTVSYSAAMRTHELSRKLRNLTLNDSSWDTYEYVTTLRELMSYDPMILKQILSFTDGNRRK